MIFKIAVGVFLGIVLAAVVLANWRLLVTVSMIAIRWTIVVALVGAVALLVYVTVQHVEHVSAEKLRIAALIGAFVLFIVGVPYAILRVVNRRYPAFANGHPPWNSGIRSWMRSIFLFGSVGVGVLALFIATYIAKILGLQLW
jgi:hypothetical protein